MTSFLQCRGCRRPVTLRLYACWCIIFLDFSFHLAFVLLVLCFKMIINCFLHWQLFVAACAPGRDTIPVQVMLLGDTLLLLDLYVVCWPEIFIYCPLVLSVATTALHFKKKSSHHCTTSCDWLTICMVPIWRCDCNNRASMERQL
jgi:hypothetical protein